MGPSFFSVNLGISRAIAFGNMPAPAAAAQPAAAGTGQAAAPAQSGAARPSSGPAPEKRYTVTLSVNIQNLLNTTNLANPIDRKSTRLNFSHLVISHAV